MSYYLLLSYCRYCKVNFTIDIASLLNHKKLTNYSGITNTVKYRKTNTVKRIIDYDWLISYGLLKLTATIVDPG